MKGRKSSKNSKQQKLRNKFKRRTSKEGRLSGKERYKRLALEEEQRKVSQMNNELAQVRKDRNTVADKHQSLEACRQSVHLPAQKGNPANEGVIHIVKELETEVREMKWVIRESTHRPLRVTDDEPMADTQQSVGRPPAP